MNQLTFSWAEHPVNPSALQVCAEDFPTTVATWHSSIYALLTDLLRAGLFGKRPGVLSSGGGRDFGSFLGALAELGYGFATECWTHSSSEWHSAAAVCSLSDTLVTTAVPQQYF